MIDFDHWLKKVGEELTEATKQKKTWIRTVERAKGGIAVLNFVKNDYQTNLAAAEAVSRMFDPPKKRIVG